MINLAIDKRRNFECSAIEQRLASPTYTVDMLSALRQDKYYNDDLYFLMGSDAFLEILSWKEYQRLFAEVNVVLAMREGDRRESVDDLLRQLGFSSANGASFMQVHAEVRLHFLFGCISKISSTQIREKLRQGESITDCVPLEVIKYIVKNGLYLTAAIQLTNTTL